MHAVPDLVVLALGVELDARPDADIVGDVGSADGVGQRLRIGRAGAFESVGDDQQRLEGEDVIGVQVDAGMALASAASSTSVSFLCGLYQGAKLIGPSANLPSVLRY